ncbi:hypothetical protein D3C84_414090 [compost metagenome]
MLAFSPSTYSSGTMRVRMAPGVMALTRIPSLTNSLAMVFIRPSCAALPTM